MYLAEVDTDSVERAQVAEVSISSAKWRDWPASTISHHGRACCEVAREWILAMDYSQLGAAAPVSGPRWLRQKYPWGPSPWPLHWCEAVGRERLDCGAHAAISQELFAARGVQSFPAQFVQHFTEDATLHWADTWEEQGVPSAWIDGDLIYHEGCAVETAPGEVRLWDASAGWWINPVQDGGYGSLISLRLFAPQGVRLTWGGRPVQPNVWTEVAQLP